LNWSIANRKLRAADGTRGSLSDALKYQYQRWRHRVTRLDPDCRETLAVLWRQLGMEATEALFGRPLLTLDRASLGEIVGSPFWRNVLLPLDKPAEVRPLFDTEFYLRQPGLDLQGLTPLGHYVLFGAGEGRDPHPVFRTAWYLTQNPDVVASGTNPLLHFVMTGGPEGRKPHPAVQGSWYRSAYSRIAVTQTAPMPDLPPLSERRYTVREVASAQDGKPAYKEPIICVSHVLPSQPRAGNEYRISRLLEWLAARGHELVLVVAPEANAEPDGARRESFFGKYPNAVICNRDGTVFVSGSALSGSVDPLDGQRIGDVVAKNPAGKTEEPLSALEANFCHDALVGVLATIAKQFPHAVYYINYAFMTRFLRHLPSVARSFVDTHDVLSDKSGKVRAFGVSDNVVIAAAEEGAMLQRAGAILAIQRDDAARLAMLAPGQQVLTAGVDFAAPDVGPPPERPTILVVAHDNPLNLKGIQDFLRFAWPSIRTARPDTKFVVVGSVARSIRYPDPRVHLAGVVDDLAAYYRDARVVINPSVAGTGLKVKTVESIAYVRPIVTFPNGVEGIGEPLLGLCHVVTDWYEFAEKVIVLLDKASDAWSGGKRQIIKTLLEPSAVYAELDRWLSAPDRAAAA
jgi:glycosyltransferase involved in cell wall biosynthesis